MIRLPNVDLLVAHRLLTIIQHWFNILTSCGPNVVLMLVQRPRRWPNINPTMAVFSLSWQVYYRGYHGDTSDTFLAGSVDVAGRQLVDHTRRIRDKAIEICGPGVPLSAIGQVIRWVETAHLAQD